MYSREFLQSLPDKKKQEEIDVMIKSFKQSLYQTAEGGQTSYFFDMTNMTNTKNITSDAKQMRHMQTFAVMNSPGFSPIPQTTMTNEEIVEELYWKAHQKGLFNEMRDEVCRLNKEYPKMSTIERVELGYMEIKRKYWDEQTGQAIPRTVTSNS